MRAIDADTAILLIQKDKIEGETLDIIKALGDGLQAETLNQACDRHINMINSLPTIEAEPKHGSWIWDKENDKMYCSECGYETDNWGVNQESDPIEWQVPNYCENCGANMRGEARAFTDEELKTYQEVIDRKSIPTSVNIMNVMDGEEND